MARKKNCLATGGSKAERAPKRRRTDEEEDEKEEEQQEEQEEVKEDQEEEEEEKLDINTVGEEELEDDELEDGEEEALPIAPNAQVLRIPVINTRAMAEAYATLIDNSPLSRGGPLASSSIVFV